jgi:type VI protein secretion system component VasK
MLMPTWAWVVVIAVVVGVLALVIWRVLMRRRTTRLQERFGPEYDRAVGAAESKRDAEAELRGREERRQQFQVRPLTQAARDRYIGNWEVVQAQFVDDPRAAVASADALIQSVMAERGYPMADFDQRAADISVDHPTVVENYRQGRQLARGAADADGATEDLRRAMRHYRALFDELVEPDADDADRGLAAENGDPSTQQPYAGTASREQDPTSTRKVP